MISEFRYDSWHDNDARVSFSACPKYQYERNRGNGGGSGRSEFVARKAGFKTKQAVRSTGVRVN